MNPSTAVRTTCPYCGVGCGVLASVNSNGGTEVSGDPTHPANFGRLCVKGAALGETMDLHGRLLHPALRPTRDSAALQRISWDEAASRIAGRFSQIIAEHGREAVALYVSGQLLTEDYYVANKFVKGYLGSGNIDTNSRLCMSSAVAAHKRAFGADLVPVCYEDLEQADLIVLVGSNTAWCHPVIYQRIAAARAARPSMKLVVIDPRRPATCEQADLHLPITPGTDVWLFNGLLAYLRREGRFNFGFLRDHTHGENETVDAAELSAGNLDEVARVCGLDPQALLDFYRLWADHERVVTAFSQGVNQSSAGVDKGNAIINCHLATGRIGMPGAGPFSITGQPNAMGGREVGGLSNQLAAHLELEDPDHRDLVRGFWGSPEIADKPGHKAVDLFEAIYDGRVKAVWIVATNPVVSLPDADRVRAALKRCEFVVVSEVNRDTDTSDLADVLLPAAAWGEKDGTVTNSERRVSRQRAFLPMPGEARPDWWAISEVAKYMGHAESFSYASAHEVFVEHARLSGWAQDRAPRMFDLSGLAELDAVGYDRLEPVQWPLRAGQTQGLQRLFEDHRYDTADGRAQLVPLIPRLPQHRADSEYPFVLNTGRVRDQWHTMSRTGKAPRLATHMLEPYVEIHPDDAAALGLNEGELARVSTRWGRCTARTRVTDSIPPQQLFIPIHWNGQTAAEARVGAVVNPVVDPLSGEPEFKHTPARIEARPAHWHAFLLIRATATADALRARFDRESLWWTRIQGADFVRFELAGTAEPDDWARWAQSLFALNAQADWIETSDPARGLYRGAWIEDDQLASCLFASRRRDTLPSRDWLSSLFGQVQLHPSQRLSLLAGRAPGPQVDHGPTVCACYNVGRNIIVDAIRKDGLKTPEALGARLKCGTNCGSCIPELRTLIASN